MPSDNVFLITRRVTSPHFNNYWLECYKSIRKYYPDTDIKIIDNNSIVEHISCPFELTNCEVIISEYPESRIYSPYFEFLKMDNYKKAIIIHDGIIFNQYVDFNNVNNVKFLWHFTTHQYDNNDNELNLINTMLNSSKLLDVYSKKLWHGCLGAMSVIDKEFIHRLEAVYKITNLTQIMKTHDYAMAFERVFSVLCFTEYPEIEHDVSFEGNVHTNMLWGYNYNDYINYPERQTDKPFFKLFGERK